MSRALLDRALCAVGMDRWWRWRRKDGLRIFMYHGVVEEVIEPFCWHMLPRRTFERQVAWIAKHFDVLPLHEGLEQLAEGTLPDRAAALTFDDGYRNNATIAAPILKRYGLPATIFLVTERIGTQIPLWPDRLFVAFRNTQARAVDLQCVELGTYTLRTQADNEHAYASLCLRLKDIPVPRWESILAGVEAQLGTAPRPTEDPFRLMTWQEIETLGADGNITFGPHSCTHPILSQCDDEQVVREVRDACVRVAKLPASTPVFAYPNGRAQDFDPRAEQAVRAAGLTRSLATIHGRAQRGSPPLAIPRLAVGADSSWAAFKLLASRG